MTKKLIKYLAIIFCIFIQINFCNAQINSESKRANHWYFGNKAGLDFTSGNPIVDLNSAMYLGETGSTISDDNGNLLFYTNGDTIWNKNHLIMANGTGLINCQSASQGGLIIQKPGTTNLYYIFTNDCGENNGVNGVHYNIVNINLNGGLGAVTTKNALLYSPSTEKFTATYHCNGNDIWLLGQVRNSNKFSSYLLTNSGINPAPILTNIGYIHNDDNFSILGGTMKFSPNGEKLAVVYAIYNPQGVEELYDFNSVTGNIYNLITLPSDTSEYGVAFSNNNQKLYIQAGGGGGIGNKIFQYDLSSNIPSLIASSKTLIHYNKWNSPILALQNGVDGKIYGTRFYLDSVAVINNPQMNGALCNYNHTAISLNGRVSRENFPQYNESYFSSIQTSTICVSGMNESAKEDDITIFPNPIIDYFIINNLSKEKIYVEIKDLMGKGIYKCEFYEEKFKVDVSNIEKGIYMLNILVNKNKIKTTKLIITNS